MASKLPRENAVEPSSPAVAIAIGLLVLVGLGVISMANLALEAFDAGVFTNVLWKVTHGAGDVSALTGAHHFADHPSGTLLLLAPFFAIGATPGVLAFVIAQAASIAIAGIAIWRLALHWGVPVRSRWALLAAVMIGPGALYAATADLHALSLGLGPLAMTISAGVRRNESPWFVVWPVLAAAARTELALVVLVVGLVLRRYDAPRHARITTGVGALFSAAFIGWIVLTPFAGSSTQVHFAHLGDTPVDVIRGAVQNPWRVIEPLFTLTPWTSVLVWIGFFGLLAPVVGWRWLTTAAPSLIIPMLGSWPNADQWITQYWYVLIPIGAVAAAAGLHARPDLNRLFPLIVGAILGVIWIVGAVTAFGGLYSSDYGSDSGARDIVANLRESTGSVAAPSQLVVPLAGREQIFVMPRPFLCAEENYGSFTRSDTRLDFVVIDNRWDFTELAAIEAVLEAAYRRELTSETVTLWRLVEPDLADVALETCRG